MHKKDQGTKDNNNGMLRQANVTKEEREELEKAAAKASTGVIKAIQFLFGVNQFFACENLFTVIRNRFITYGRTGCKRCGNWTKLLC